MSAGYYDDSPVALFAVQQWGTALIGRFLGPIMAIWFAVLALLGLWGIAQYPAVLWAINPALGLHYLFTGGGNVMLVLGGIQLGVLPRLRIIQTSAAGYGQIYLPAVNWLLMAATLTLAIGFGTSDNLAAAYGIAVSADMVVTTLLLSIAIREIWGWPMPAVIGIGAGFATVEGGFLSANLLKFTEGGWVPVLLAIVLFTLMRIWKAGIAAVQKLADEMQIPIGDIVAQIDRGQVPRVPGTGVFVARITRDIPPLVVWHLRHIRSLHDSIVILDVLTAFVPYVAAEDRLEIREIAPRVWRAHARFGFMEQPDLPALLQQAQAKGFPVDPANATYFIGHVTIVPREDGKGLPRLVRATIAFLRYNSVEAIEYFRLPRDMVVEIGRQFAI